MTKGNQTKRIQSHDWEALSAYLDGQLAPNERSRLEKRLKASSDLRTALDELRRTRIVLRSQPRLRAPRNFTLTLEMVGRRKPSRGYPNLFPTLGLTSALASALLIVVFLFDLFGGGQAGAPAMVAMQVTQEAVLKSNASTEAPAAIDQPGLSPEAASQLPELQQQAREQDEATASTEEAAMALEAALPTQSPEQMTEIARMTAAPPGMGELPAPVAEATPTLMVESGMEAEGEPYPLPAEEPASVLSATEGVSTPAIPTPAPMLSDTVSGQQENFSQQSSDPGAPAEESETLDQAAPDEAAPAGSTPLQPGFWTPLRLLEAALALIAISAAVAAFTLRRISGA